MAPQPAEPSLPLVSEDTLGAVAADFALNPLRTAEVLERMSQEDENPNLAVGIAKVTEAMSAGDTSKRLDLLTVAMMVYSSLQSQLEAGAMDASLNPKP
jgi:hypothetical protein